jgi:hypothetical protein
VLVSALHPSISGLASPSADSSHDACMHACERREMAAEGEEVCTQGTHTHGNPC